MSDDDEKLTLAERWYAFTVWAMWFKPRVAMRRSRHVWNRWFPNREICVVDWCFRVVDRYGGGFCPKHLAELRERRRTAGLS